MTTVGVKVLKRKRFKYLMVKVDVWSAVSMSAPPSTLTNLTVNRSFSSDNSSATIDIVICPRDTPFFSVRLPTVGVMSLEGRVLAVSCRLTFQ